jgi:hypothetical protein
MRSHLERVAADHALSSLPLQNLFTLKVGQAEALCDDHPLEGLVEEQGTALPAILQTTFRPVADPLAHGVYEVAILGHDLDADLRKPLASLGLCRLRLLGT